MRKLATFALFFAASVFCAHFVLPTGWLLPLAIFLILFGSAAILIKTGIRIRIVLIAFGMGLGCIWYLGFTQIFFTPAQDLDGRTETVSAFLVDYPNKTDYGYSVTLNVKIPGKPAVTTRLYTYGSELSNLVPGDSIQVTARFSLASFRQGEEVDYYTAKGIFLLANSQEKLEYSGKAPFQARYLPAKLTHLLREKISEIFPEGDAAGFMQALLTGDKSKLSSSLDTALQTTGVSHIVAVSGMHVAFLVGLVQILTEKRRKTALLSIPVILLFMAMMGGSPSVSRAGIMQIMMLAAGSLRREYDGITALSFSLLVLLLANPYSIANIGLQLSFAATLGIVLFSGQINKRLVRKVKSKRKAVLKAVNLVSSSLSVSIGATVFTMPLAALYFGYISLVAPLTNLLVLWAVSLTFTLGLPVCLAGFASPLLGKGLAFVVSLFIRYIIGVVGALSKIPLAAVYTGNIYIVFWLVFVYLLAGVLFFFKGTRKSIVFAGGMAVCYLCLAVFLAGFSVSSERLTFTVLDVGQGQSTVFFSGSQTVVVDCGSSSGANAGNIAAEYLMSHNRYTVDMLILTHFHADHANGVMTLLERLDVKLIVSPKPDGSEGDMYKNILELSEKTGVSVWYLETDSTAYMGDMVLNLISPIGNEGLNEKGLSVLAGAGDFDVLITGDMQAAIERRLIKENELPDIEVMVAGHHGSRYSNSMDLLQAATPEIVIIPVGYNSYGHPADEVLERFYESGIQIYRTDLMGNIKVRSGGNYGEK